MIDLHTWFHTLLLWTMVSYILTTCKWCSGPLCHLRSFWITGAYMFWFRFFPSPFKWHFCFSKRTLPLLVCSSIPSSCVALLTLFVFASFLNPSSFSLLSFFVPLSFYLFPSLFHTVFTSLVHSIIVFFSLSFPALFFLSVTVMLSHGNLYNNNVTATPITVT